MASYEVNPNAMDEATQSLRAVTSSLDQSLQELQSAAQNFMSHNEGMAIDGYNEAHHEWSAGMREMHDALDGRAVSLLNINQNYVDADRRGMSYFQSR